MEVRQNCVYLSPSDKPVTSVDLVWSTKDRELPEKAEQWASANVYWNGKRTRIVVYNNYDFDKKGQAQRIYSVSFEHKTPSGGFRGLKNYSWISDVGNIRTEADLTKFLLEAQKKKLK